MFVPNTIKYRITEYIYTQGSLTIAQIAEAYPAINENTLRSAIGRLVANSHIERDGDVLTATADTRRYFDRLQADRTPRQVAQKRDFNPFGHALNPSRLPSLYGMREGADDFRAWPSRY